MFRHCIFCCTDLGSNESIEEFPVGRRLAFDALRGRLWVVCRRCERWNLSPLDERWEAIERMEQLYRDTRLRVSGEQIGLARLSGGTELVRVGSPLRPEFAAWRYGDQFGRRRRRAIVGTGLAIGVGGALVAGAAAAGIGFVVFANGSRLVMRRLGYGPETVITRLDDGPGEPITIRRRHLNEIRLEASGNQDEFRLRIPITEQLGTYKFSGRRVLEYTDDEAIRIAGRLLPSLNRFGGNSRTVTGAVEMLESAGDPVRTFSLAARAKQYTPINQLSAPVRLALEMAAHEEQERRALEGELAILEQAWREAEEVADIADRLLIPESVTQALARLRASVTR